MGAIQISGQEALTTSNSMIFDEKGIKIWCQKLINACSKY